MPVALAILAVLSIWDYPSRHSEHVRLSRQLIAAIREGDTQTMEETCRKGVALLPDDPTWHYNLACSLAYFAKREDQAFDELDTAITLGFRDKDKIASDRDLKRLESHPRYAEALEYAESMARRPVLTGPMATVECRGVFGQSVALGEQNFGWDFQLGCFVAKMRMAVASAGGNVGDLYMNRDGQHSPLNLSRFPGLTAVGLDQEGRNRRMDRDAPNILFPYPVFGNCSTAYVHGPYWRSIPRMLMTSGAGQLGKMVKFYLTNQTWVFPANADTAPVGTNGDVFASIAPYWIATAGRSYSDQPYVCAALEASRAFASPVKRELVRRGLLAPTIQTLIRKSFRDVRTEDDYLSARAHPSAFPANAVEVNRLVGSAAALTVEGIPPLAPIAVTADSVRPSGTWPELTYASAFAWAFVLRADEMERTFRVVAQGATEFAFVQTHGNGIDVRIEREDDGKSARIVINRKGMSPTNRVDVAVFGRNRGTSWGAPSYISFARMDAAAPYSDPALTPLPQPPSE